MNNPLLLLFIGVCVGIYGGLMGLGGGTIMIPVMVLLLGFTQKSANATSLAVMLPPVMLPALIQFYREGVVNIPVALWIAVGVTGGSLLGWKISSYLDDRALKLIFGFVITYIGAYTVLNTIGPQHLVRSIILSTVLTLLVGGVFIAARILDAKPA
ncbi:MAG: sulfite exporter TauE/SafE family protein [Tepidisphaeraceae bacterium]|jgi:hypothetical protein